MNFSAIKEISIPEGSVICINREDNLLWTRCNLPKEYQQLSYIETDGTQYIDTMVIARNYDAGIQYRLHGCVTGFKQKSGNNYLFGCLDNNQRSCNISMNTTAASNATNIHIGAASQAIWSAELPELNVDFVLEVTATSERPNDISAKLNGVPFEHVHTSTASQMPNASIYLLWCNGVGSSSMPYVGKLYSFTMKTVDNTPIRSFIPCRRIADETIGLFDTVENIFYENIGTGSFLAGDEI